MTIFIPDFVLCMATTGALALFARSLVDRARPSVAVPLLAIGCLVNAASMGLLLSLLALAGLAQLPAVASAGDWSIDVLALNLPVPLVIGVAAGAVVAVLLARTFWRAGRIVFVLGQSDRLSRRIRGAGGPIAIVDTGAADAFTLAGVKGCVVISRELFSALGSAERHMLTAHEMSHLRHRHHLYVQATDIAIAANPALARVADPIRLGVERWADEDAVAVTGDRTAAAAALANTALIRSALRRADPNPRPVTTLPVLCVAASHVSQRARALMSSTPGRTALGTALTVLLIVTGAGTVGSTLQVHDGFEHAEKHCHHAA
jgi:Zn-dependent protease with chaperone function